MNNLELAIYENYLTLGFRTVFQPAQIAADSHDDSLIKKIVVVLSFSYAALFQEKLNVNITNKNF